MEPTSVTMKLQHIAALERLGLELPQNSNLSLAAWYLHKFDQCRGMAASAEPLLRCEHQAEGQLWLRMLAEEIGVAEPDLIALLDQERSNVLS